jgi:predicted nuclease of predicted toxin-antitoxin system
VHLLADEGVHQGVVTALRRAEYSVTYVAETMPGAADQKILSKAAELEAVLITSDKDFGDLVFRQKLTHRGVILLRLFGSPLAEQTDVVLELLRTYPDKVESCFTVVDRNGFRFRHDPY